MVSIKTIFSIATLVAVVLGGIWLAKGGAAKIGSALGGGLNNIGSGFINSFSQGIGSFAPNETEGTQTLQGIIAQEGLQDNVAGVPETDIPVPLTPLEKGRLTLAGFLEANNISGTINLTSGVFTNQYTTQDLDFAIDPNTGIVKTGSIGLSDSTLQYQRELSARYGIPTFDVEGNISTFGGFTTER